MTGVVNDLVTILVFFCFLVNQQEVTSTYRVRVYPSSPLGSFRLPLPVLLSHVAGPGTYSSGFAFEVLFFPEWPACI